MSTVPEATSNAATTPTTASEPPITAPQRSSPAWPRWALRIMSVVTAIMLFDQAVFAGQFLSGVYPMLRTHAENATYAALSVLLTVVAAILARWPGHGPRWPIPAYVVLLVLVAAQAVMGYAHVIAVHVPLGVAIIVVAIGVAARVWRRV